MVTKRIPKKIEALVRRYGDRLVKKEKFPIDRVVVFGSRVRGEARKWSDIDVCVVSSRFKDPFDATTFLWKKRTRDEVMAGLEPIGITPKDFQEGGFLIDEIKRTGVRVR